MCVCYFSFMYISDNKFDKALTIEHVESGVAFLCLLHYTGDKVFRFWRPILSYNYLGHIKNT